MQDLIGKQLDQYRIDALLGQGDLGVVYRAFDANLAQDAALKVIHPHVTAHKHVPERLMASARAAARLAHPAIADLYDAGMHAGQLYVVTTYVDGGSLGNYLNELQAGGWSVDLQELLEVLAQVAEALAYAHRQGLVHADIRPENVLLERVAPGPANGGTGIGAVVTDFAQAELREGIAGPPGTVSSGLPYLAPEQCLGAVVDGRADLYALGAMLYQLTTGRLPFAIRSLADAVVKHMKMQPPTALELQPNLPVKVDAIIRKAIAKEPGERFADGAYLARALRAAAAELTVDQLAHFAPPSTVHSISTAIASRSAAGAEDVAARRPAQPPAKYLAVVARPNEATQRIPLRGLTLIVGRAAECDLVLDASGVSRQQVRLERTIAGWQIVDLGSTNGTFLDRNRLLAGVAERWDRERALRIGPFSIQWEENRELVG